ncbi:MAG: TIGR01459 family HAD-type hydrolase [Pseudomonadota bacterium]|nr:TIGR01459 family HAD-type hydrolase [Pseudomonadota bacterium]
MRHLKNLSEIYKNYDTFIIDLWGVIHNGIRLNDNAIKTIEQLSKNFKKIVFLSNAPRPKSKVINFLLKMGMEKKYLTNVITSGEAAMHAINKNKFGKTFFHLGPPRDTSVFEKVKNNRISIEKCDFILCTGLFDEYEEDLNYYKNFLKKYTSKKLICTNPDLTVHRGNIEELCAGSLAKVFEELGGEVVYFGKPHREVYSLCYEKKDRVLAIGDNLKTDIQGANNLKLESLFITNGVHREELNKTDNLDTLFKKYKVKTDFYQKELTW